MRALILAVVALWIAGGCGRLIVGRFSVWKERSPLERFAFSAACGLGLAAYGVLALGLLGMLSFWPVTLWWLILALVGFRGMHANFVDVRAGLQRRSAPDATDRREHRVFYLALGAVFICGLLALLGCFRPPLGREWDAISYHLADPKLFLMLGRIVGLPTEHHSNFPFTLEMLFTVGLLYDGYPLANLFHFMTTGLTVIALLGFCARTFTPAVGAIAALLFVTTPLVLWEASVAYIDLGLGLYTTLAAFALVSAVTSEKGESQREWILLAGGAMGFALGIKYLALLPFGLTALYLALRRVPLKSICIYAGLAALIASPWYIKNIVMTANPVYPYLYSLFPQSRYWSADRAAPYQAEQGSFGYANGLTVQGRIEEGTAAPAGKGTPRDGIMNLMQTPWRLASDADKYANRGDYTFTTLYGGLYAAFGLALVFLRRVPRPVLDLFWLGVLQVILWFFVAQVGRYLLSILPLLAVGCGYAAWRLLNFGSEAGQERVDGPATVLRGTVMLLLAGQFALLMWGVFYLPTGGRAAIERGVLPTGFSVPETLSDLTHLSEREEALTRRLDVYGASTWINQNTPKEAKLVLFEETRGFYLDRFYLWGNGEHSSYIPYETLQDGKELTDWFLREGVHYAIINLNWSPSRFAGLEMAVGPAGYEEAMLNRWYIEAPQTAKYRELLRDALQKGLWRFVYGRNGVAVLELGEAKP